MLCVQWKTPDDRQRNGPKHVEFYSKNKFKKLVHLVGFIIRTLVNFRLTVVLLCRRVVDSSWNVMAHGDARKGKWRGNWRMQWVASTLHSTRNMVYPALLPLMRTPRLPVVDWTDAPADLKGLVRFPERRNLVSACVPSHFNWPLLTLVCQLRGADNTCTGQRPYRNGRKVSISESFGGLSSSPVKIASDPAASTVGSIRTACLKTEQSTFWPPDCICWFLVSFGIRSRCL